MRLALVFVLLACPAGAAEINFNCLFDYVCDPNTKCSDAELDRRFRLDSETNEARVIGGEDLDQIEVVIGDRAVTFLERQISGAVAATTVNTTTGDAVYSHMRFDGTVMKTGQYLGQCAVF